MRSRHYLSRSRGHGQLIKPVTSPPPADYAKIFWGSINKANRFISTPLHLLAAVQIRSGRLTEALASYDTVLSIRPQFPDALNSRANIFKALRRFDEALADYDRALAARPDFVEALNNRGNLLTQMKRFDEALANFDKALAIRPRYAVALNNRGNALQALRRFDEAVISFDQALAIKPDFARRAEQSRPRAGGAAALR